MTRSQSIRRYALISMLVVLSGCGGQQFSPQGRELLTPLQTAISARNLEWIDATEKKLEAQVDEGTVTDEEVAVLASIIDECRAGDWKRAQTQLQTIIDTQRATTEDLQQLRDGEIRSAAERRKQSKKVKS